MKNNEMDGCFSVLQTTETGRNGVKSDSVSVVSGVPCCFLFTSLISCQTLSLK